MISRFHTTALVLLCVLLAGCSQYAVEQIASNRTPTDAKPSVIVVGAGASGLTAGYLLNKAGVDVTIIEAKDVYGGRMRETQHFADFPIDLGAEWIHEDPSVLQDLVPEYDVEAHTIEYNPQTIFSWVDSRLIDHKKYANWYSEYKFYDTTWFAYFEEHIVPSIRSSIVLGEPVSSIEYSGEKVVVTTVHNTNYDLTANTYSADKVLVTVPISVLQKEFITFTPALPEEKKQAIQSVTFADALKVFIEFDERFYPDILSIGDFWETAEAEEKIYYDAAFKKDTNRNILGLFVVGSRATELANLYPESQIATILAELDEIYDGAATEHYIKHVTQNWAWESFIEGGYSTHHHGNRRAIITALRKPVGNKVFFSGEALSYDNQATVPGAAQSAAEAVELILKSL